VRIEQVDLNGNTEHVTCHGVCADEIIQVFTNKPRISRNRNHRSAGTARSVTLTEADRSALTSVTTPPDALLGRSVHGRTDEHAARL
jgi:hypothetical protein